MDRNRPRVLVIASDTIGQRMAGSGIRYWNFARVLGRQQPVTLAMPNSVSLDPPDGVDLVSYAGDTEDARGRRQVELIEQHDVIVAQHLPYLYADAEILKSKHIVLDLYAPWVLEKLEYSRIDPVRGEPNRKDDITILHRLLSLGDYFICASERQRDYWLGALTHAGRLDLAHVQDDPELRNLLDIVPFGLPGPMPLPDGPGPRDTFDGISSNDPVLIWNGGLWNWLDPLTAIRAAGILAAGDQPDVRLVFMGTKSPGAQVAEMSMVDSARDLASSLGLLGSHVFFNDWVDYDHRHNWLLQSDIALSLHYPTVEARFSFRTRLLDNLWCGLPTVATHGDVLADLVAEKRIGRVVPPGDAVAVASAVTDLLDSASGREVRERITTVAANHTWEHVCGPLARWCLDPRKIGAGMALSPEATYLHDLERTYTETARYARELEEAIADKNRALEAQANARPGDRILRRFRKLG